jgi:hypothetical protein
MAPPARRFATLLLAVVVALAGASLVSAATVHLIVQRGRAFAVKSIAIAAGDTLHFGNEDSFIHQIFVDSPNLQFDSRNCVSPASGESPASCRCTRKEFT